MGEKIIEVLGPPGVGKSTIYKALCARWTPQASWTCQDALLRPAQPALGDFGKWIRHLAGMLLGKSRTRNPPVDFGIRFAQAHPALASFYWQHLSDTSFGYNGQEAHRFRSAYFLFADFCRYQAIRESACGKPCVIDEGLLQKSFLLHDDRQQMQNLVAAYFRLLPLPYALLYIDTPELQLIGQRLQQRQKIHITHQGKGQEALAAETKKWQYLLDAILEESEKRQVPIHKIDGARPVADNVDQISKFLADLT